MMWVKKYNAIIRHVDVLMNVQATWAGKSKSNPLEVITLMWKSEGGALYLVVTNRG